MRAIIFDTETNGKAKNFNAPVTDLNNWPRIVQLAWKFIDTDTLEVIEQDVQMIKPDGWTIPKEKFFLDNNLTTERCEAEGKPLFIVLENFIDHINTADVLVAHNIDFDKNVVGAEFIRTGLKSKVLPKICTMKSTTDLCKIPGPLGYKWPKLEELYLFLFNEKMGNAHDAMDDVTNTTACFLELLNRKVLSV